MNIQELRKLRIQGAMHLLPTYEERRDTLNRLLHARTQLRRENRVPIKKRLPGILALTEMIDVLEHILNIHQVNSKS